MERWEDGKVEGWGMEGQMDGEMGMKGWRDEDGGMEGGKRSRGAGSCLHRYRADGEAGPVESRASLPVTLIQIRPGPLSRRLQNIRFISHSSRDVLPRFQGKIYYTG